jgi:hypothetical protein
MNNSHPMNHSTKNLTGRWNRSSALKPEKIGMLNAATYAAIESAIQNFTRVVDFESLTPELQLEAVQMVANGVTTELAAYVETLKAQYGSALQGRT